MQGDGRKGKGQRLLAHLIWLPLIAALLMQYALALFVQGSSPNDPQNPPHSNAAPVTYEVTVSQDGQILSSSVKEPPTENVVSSDTSASTAFLQAASENDAVENLLGSHESVVRSLQACIDREISKVEAKADKTKSEESRQSADSGDAAAAQSLKGLKINGNDIGEKRMARLAGNRPGYTSEVEYIDQNGFMPSGCEFVALEVALHRMGYDEVEAEDIAEDYVEYGSDPERYYTGSPYGVGGGFAACIVDAANAWLEENGDGEEAYDLTGSSFESICALVELGYPVLIWTTEDMAEPDLGQSWYQPEHCVLMYGVEKVSKQDDKKHGGEKTSDSQKESAASSDKSASSKSAATDGSKSSASAKSDASGSSASASAKSSASKSSAAGSSKSASSSSASAPSKSSASSSSGGSSKSVASSAAASSKSAENSREQGSSSSSSVAASAEYKSVLVSDSLAGLVKRDYADFKEIYDKVGKRALFIQPKS